MLTSIIPIVIAAIFLTLVLLMSSAFHRAISKSSTKLMLVLSALWSFIFIFPWAVTWLYVPLLNSVYTSNPELQSAAWDVAVALAIYLGMWLSYALGLIAGCLATWKLVRLSRRQHRANVT
ncbi:hypothetical protein D3C85_1578630 [compost metagenome]